MKNIQDELIEISGFVKQSHISDSIKEMEINLDMANGYSQRIGELLNEATQDYEKSFVKELDKLSQLDDETETTRKAKLLSWTADKKYLMNSLKTLKGSLRSIQMTMLQAIKTRREEPH